MNQEQPTPTQLVEQATQERNSWNSAPLNNLERLSHNLATELEAAQKEVVQMKTNEPYKTMSNCMADFAKDNDNLRSQLAASQKINDDWTIKAVGWCEKIGNLQEQLAAKTRECEEMIQEIGELNSQKQQHPKSFNNQPDCEQMPCGHNSYWRTHYGNWMACRAENSEKENAELKRDKERLDWLGVLEDGCLDRCCNLYFDTPKGQTLRAAIDSAMKGNTQ